MKNFLTLLLLLCLAAGGFAQKKSFEGVTTFSTSYKSHMKDVTDEQLDQYFGTKQLYYCKGAHAKFVNGGKLFEWSMYVPAEKRVYDKLVRSDSALWYSTEINHDTLYKTELKRNDTTILGYACDRLTFTCKDETQVYYFCTEFYVDPELYVDFKEVNFYAFLKIAKSIALKEVFSNRSFTETLTAIEIKRMPVDDQLFEIQPGTPIGEEKRE
ncbi:MAG: hypothetical protein ACXVB0_21165 [Mucilaginibacter sp.]